jgi:hypothetical protein
MAVLKVVHCKIEPYDVYIGRPSKWGNPFHLKAEVSRRNILEHYRYWILGNKKLLLSLHELDNKVLGCWCAPRMCHGHILAELVDILFYGEYTTRWNKEELQMLGSYKIPRPDPWTMCEDEMMIGE